MSRWLVLLPALLAVVTADGHSQVRGFPVYAAPIARGLTIGADVAFPESDLCPGTCVGASASFGYGRLGISGTVANSGYGAMLGLALVRDESSPYELALQAGIAGTSTAGDVQAPFGVGFGIWIPTPVVSLEPWVGFRGQYMDPADGWNGAGTVHAAFSAGVGLTLFSGLGVRLAYDRVYLPGNDLSTFGVGVFYSFDSGH